MLTGAAPPAAMPRCRARERARGGGKTSVTMMSEAGGGRRNAHGSDAVRRDAEMPSKVERSGQMKILRNDDERVCEKDVARAVHARICVETRMVEEYVAGGNAHVEQKLAHRRHL